MVELELEMMELFISTLVICIFECSMFTKMGVSGGLAFVPIYKDWIISTKSSQSKRYFVISCIYNVALIIFAVYTFRMVNQVANNLLSRSDFEGAPLGLYIFLLIVLAILGLVRAYFYSEDVAVAFGRGGGFKIGLFFLHPIFVAILAYGPAEYIGPDGYPEGSFSSYNRDEI